MGVEPVKETGAPISKMAPLLESIPPARLFEEVCKLFLTGHATRTLEALQRFQLTLSLFPVLKPKGVKGKAEVGPLLMQAMVNTDERIEQQRSGTPAFLFAALLWQPVRDKTAKLMEQGLTEFQALQQAGDEVLAEQVRRTAIPRRLSAVTRQIWEMQARFRKTRGKRAMSVLHQPRFRAGYDFLLLRIIEDETLAELGEFWTRAQKDMPPSAIRPPVKKRKRRRRRSRKSAGSS